MKVVKVTRRLPTPWNLAAAQWLKSSGVWKSGVHSEQASGRLSKETERTCWASHPNAFFERLALECCQHCCRDSRVGGQPVNAQTIRRTLHQIGVHDCHPRRRPLLKTIHKKARKQFVEDMSKKRMDYWNHVLWSAEVKINLFGSDGFKHVWQRPGEE